MRLSTSIIIVSAVVSTVAAYPTDFIKRGVSSALSFPCGDDVPNVNLHLALLFSIVLTSVYYLVGCKH